VRSGATRFQPTRPDSIDDRGEDGVGPSQVDDGGSMGGGGHSGN
jgi:hypothetical protein